jgi:hypothetical protein
MRWIQRYRISNFIRSALWLVPLASMTLAVLLTPLLRKLDQAMGWTLFGFGLDGTRALLAMLAASMLSLLVFVLSALPPRRTARPAGRWRPSRSSGGGDSLHGRRPDGPAVLLEVAVIPAPGDAHAHTDGALACFALDAPAQMLRQGDLYLARLVLDHGKAERARPGADVDDLALHGNDVALLGHRVDFGDGMHGAARLALPGMRRLEARTENQGDGEMGDAMHGLSFQRRIGSEGRAVALSELALSGARMERS